MILFGPGGGAIVVLNAAIQNGVVFTWWDVGLFVALTAFFVALVSLIVWKTK